MDPSYFVSKFQAAGGVMAWGKFSLHTLDALVQGKHHLNTTAYLSIVDYTTKLWEQCTQVPKAASSW